jgi:sec-independent protein translocase protein TatB
MFDVGFWEISLILVVMLIVVGPERLPGLARKAGLWIGKARRMVAEVKAEVDRELQIDEIRQSINQEANISDLKQLAQEARKLDGELRQEAQTLKSDISRARGPASGEKGTAEAGLGRGGGGDRPPENSAMAAPLSDMNEAAKPEEAEDRASRGDGAPSNSPANKSRSK